ncbi:DUF805 domain-containing protein [Devosia sp.]|uniref:DUF805 domain-containing protein n=1 Tax=Devosia sp. TaxID=1871048 RepID=UPI0032662586
MTAYFASMRNYFGLSGRLSRAVYWQFMLVVALLSVAGVFIDYRLGQRVFASGRPGKALLLVWVIHLLPFIAASVRRIHDSDQSGWLYWLIYIPVIGWIPFLGLVLAKGSDGPNRYGPTMQMPERPTPERWSLSRHMQADYKIYSGPDDTAASPVESPAAAPSAPRPSEQGSQPQPAPPAAIGPLIDQLERLASLRASGAIDDAEFALMKADLLARAAK